jgi:hypothetical protein
MHKCVYKSTAGAPYKFPGASTSSIIVVTAAYRKPHQGDDDIHVYMVDERTYNIHVHLYSNSKGGWVGI